MPRSAGIHLLIAAPRDRIGSTSTTECSSMTSLFKSPRLAAVLATVSIAALSVATPASAAESATATLSSIELSPTSWQYSLTLNDIGTTDLGTLWFAWLPGQDFMPTSPTNVTTPDSWTDTITGGGANNGYAIRWVAGTGAALTPGQSLTGFTFDSSTSPDQMAADSPFYPTTPVLTSVVYSGAPFSDAGEQFVVQAAAVPEPSTIALMSLGALLLAARTLRRQRSPGMA
jgi:hypothetical protein